MNLIYIDCSLVVVNDHWQTDKNKWWSWSRMHTFSRAGQGEFLCFQQITRHDREFGLELGLPTGPIGWKRAF